MTKENLYHKLNKTQDYRDSEGINEVLPRGVEYKDSKDPVGEFISFCQNKQITHACRTNQSLRRAVQGESETYQQKSITNQLKGLKKSFFPRRVNEKHNQQVSELESILGENLSELKTKGMMCPDNHVTATIETAITAYAALKFTGHQLYTSGGIQDNPILLGYLFLLGAIVMGQSINHINSAFPTQKAEYVDSVILKLEVESYNK